ncbi:MULTISPECIES: FKBP-type peptidyl-prolyl cis-trans isomerase [Blautia]|uniref:FKBP-type peptidyl-prolyl cis-trans isomerase n=1 Tax=Blautia TaxID=572511 RepID=UPI00136D12F1|nr:FKBP-type peptidyl-prolyl cis-trans isomerase [Blautia sp. BIOML-A1]MZT65732.1 FKBP-type peptidylprolyl isomerase [Blautia sp. BIOML-A1]
MKEMTKKTAVVAMAGIMAAGMLTGCGEKKLDGSKTVATVDGTKIPLGVVSLSVREGQMQTEAMYRSYMGGSDFDIWDTEAEKGKTYGEQAVEESLKDVELMYIMKAKAADYDVELTDEDEKAIAEVAASFMEANSEETIADLAVTEDQVKTYLELQTYKQKIHDPIIADVDKNVSDEEAQQSSFEYVSVSTADLSDDEIKEKKEDAQKILDGLKADPDGDFSEIAKSVDDSYSSLSGTFDANETSEDEDTDDEDADEDSSSYSGTYPEEVIDVLRTLDDGEVASDIIETDTAYYVVKLNKKDDEEATETKKESIISTREQTLYTDTTEKWLDDADIKEKKKVLKTLKVTDNHKYVAPTATPAPTEEAAETEEVTETPEADATETPEVTEAADTTTTPEATEAPSYSTDTSLTVKDGDTVNIDYVGKIDGTAFDGGSTNGQGTDLEIGSGSYIDDFEDQLVGAHPGDEVEVTVTFPDDYGAADLAGKEAVFDVTVNGIYE